MTSDVRIVNFGNEMATLLFLENAQWEAQVYEFELNFEGYRTVDLTISIQLSTGDCCSGIPRIESYELDGNIQSNLGNVVTIELN